MNVPPPATAKTFAKNCVIGKYVEKVAKETMETTGKEVRILKSCQNSNPTSCAVSHVMKHTFHQLGGLQFMFL